MKLHQKQNYVVTLFRKAISILESIEKKKSD